jgi:excinuclease UvrABC nuclease subunit
VVDGNAIQKRVAELVLQKHALLIPVVAVVKDERHKASRLIGPTELLKRCREDILHSNAEAHRFAITYFRTKQRKRALS